MEIFVRQLRNTTIRCIAVIFVCAIPAIAPADVTDGERAYQYMDYEHAYPAFARAAKKGDARAQFYLGEMFEGGIWVTQDQVAAIRWYRKAASQGYARAEGRLASIYSRGAGVKRSPETAFFWYLKAARNGSTLDQYETGRRYLEGRGTRIDPVKAYKWLSIAASDGDPDAADLLGDLAATMTMRQKEAGAKLVDTWERDAAHPPAAP